MRNRIFENGGMTMFQIKLRRPGRGIILAVVAVIVLVGAVGFGIL